MLPSKEKTLKFRTKIHRITYVSGLPFEQDKIFIRGFNKSRWDKVRQKVGLADFKFHDILRTFGSVLAQHYITSTRTKRG